MKKKTHRPAPTGPDGDFWPFMVPAFIFLYLLGHAERMTSLRKR